MGNTIRKINLCSNPTGDISRRHDITIILTKKPLDEDLGHSFCYIRPDPYPLSTSNSICDHKNQSIPQKTTTFSCISGASVSANTSTPLSTSFIDVYMYTNFDKASAFQCSASFVSIPLQPVPFSGRIERGFCSGPIERIFESGPIDKGLYSGLVEKGCDQFQLQRSFSNREFGVKQSTKKQGILRKFQKSIEKTLLKRGKSMDSVKESNSGHGLERNSENNGLGSINLSSELSLNCDDEFYHDEYDDGFLSKSQNLQWAQGKAGEDRVHIVISDENEWVFVGIYDGFNGPDAPDFLLSNLYSAVHNELKGLLSNDKYERKNEEFDSTQLRKSCLDQNNHNSATGFSKSDSELNENETKKLVKQVTMKWDREKTEQFVTQKINHDDILKALSIALKKTEDAYLDIADKMLMENPELALMGSCVLAMLMKGEDVYLMSVGDSRAVLAQDPDQFEPFNRDELCESPSLDTLQLTMDHSTSVKEEVHRIKKEHPDDTCAIMNDRVKGSLKVTRAFGAGFLKQPKWNNALLEMFRIDYMGSSPYINCNPYLYHHKLGSRDRFLILSSDGLYQYFTNEEAVCQVESFMCSSPEGDPAQHLIEEVLFRAAKRAGMDFHELLEIPQGDRRRFHDDVSIIIISLEGRIWRSSV